MSTRIKIKVTKDILEESKDCKFSESIHNCAIAVAIRDIFPQAAVAGTYIQFLPYPNHNIRISLPLFVTQFITKFDTSTSKMRVKLDEIEFEIDVPDEVIDGIKIKEDLEEIFAKSPTMSLVTT